MKGERERERENWRCRRIDFCAGKGRFVNNWTET